jgi:hypothetical protein
LGDLAWAHGVCTGAIASTKANASAVIPLAIVMSVDAPPGHRLVPLESSGHPADIQLTVAAGARASA